MRRLPSASYDGTRSQGQGSLVARGGNDPEEVHGSPSARVHLMLHAKNLSRKGTKAERNKYRGKYRGPAAVFRSHGE